MLKIETPSGIWGPFVKRIESFLEADIVRLVTNGVPVSGYRSPDSPALWIRDHSDILRGGIYFNPDVHSAVDAFAGSQAPNGRVFDNVTTQPTATEKENWEKWIRVQVEADVEFRFVKAGYLAWRASGDMDWLNALLPAFDAALTYSRSHPWRWDFDLGLVKRAYTIDTWDFDYTAGKYPWLNFQLGDDTFWGIFHGDNSGMYEAAMLLAKMNRAAGRLHSAEEWEVFADDLKRRANELLFNGRFYTHFHKLTDVTVPGVDEAEQLSLSTPMAINRGMTTPEISKAILQEYLKRRRETAAFAEWFGIDPPFPAGAFGDDKLVPGAYINGGIFPLTGGEIARAAFENGLESYGLQTLYQYAKMIAETGESYLWYLPDGTPSSEENSTSPEALPTDGWGSTSMLYALVEGLCGIEDQTCCFQEVRLAPRWLFAGEDRADVQIGYPASGAEFGYVYAYDDASNMISLDVSGKSDVDFHLPLPVGAVCTTVMINGESSPWTTVAVEESTYIDFRARVDETSRIELAFTAAQT